MKRQIYQALMRRVHTAKEQNLDMTTKQALVCVIVGTAPSPADTDKRKE